MHNIIFLVVDTLRQDRLGCSGHRPAVTPNLDKLVREGTSCSAHFAAGGNTQVSFPTMFTSTRPLDYGGYNDGIRRRPVSFPETLQDNGYQTFGVVTGHPASSHFGYDRGFDEFIDLIDLYQWFRSIFKTMLRELFERWQDGQLSDDEMFSALHKTYGRCLEGSEGYIASLDSCGVPSRGLPRGKLLVDVRAERELLARDPHAICEKLIELDQDFQYFFGEPAVTDRIRNWIARRDRRRALINRKVALVSERRAFEAHTVNRMFKKFLSRRDTDRPFFAFLHYFDLHESKLLLSNHSSRNIARYPAALYAAARGRRKKQGGLLYDIVLSTVDYELGRLRRMLERHGVADDTVFVITGDHGTEAGAPYRKVGGNFAKLFYEEFVHVPLIVHGPGVPAREIDTLASHFDIPPTILDIAGLPVPPSFEGEPLSRRVQMPPPYVWNENAGNGRCDLDEKPLYLSLRCDRYKSIYESHEFVVSEREFYDLSEDPGEKNDLAASDREKPLRQDRLRVVQERVNRIRRFLDTETQAEAVSKSA